MGVLDRFEQVLALHLQELVAFGGFSVFLKCHHVDGAHRIQAAAHFAIGLVFNDELFAGRNRDGRIRHEFMALHSEFVQAVFSHVLRVRLQFGGSRAQFAAMVARLIQHLAGTAQALINFGQACSDLLGLELQQAIPCLTGITLGLEIG